MSVDNNMSIKEAVCVHTKKVYDSCKDKDCMENLRVYPTRQGQHIIDHALSVKCRKAELLWVYIDVENVAFNRGFYTVDVRYFYRITVEAFCGMGRPQEVCGVATCEKRVILFGSEGNAKVFSSTMSENALDEQLLMRSNMPTAVVECVEPICLDVKIVETCTCPKCGCPEFPRVICGCFDDELVTGDGENRLYCTLGQFSIIKLERDSQLIMPAYDIAMPDKECVANSEDGPCDMFSKIAFPVDEFFPPNRCALEASSTCPPQSRTGNQNNRNCNCR